MTPARGQPRFIPCDDVLECTWLGEVHLPESAPLGVLDWVCGLVPISGQAPYRTATRQVLALCRRETFDALTHNIYSP